MSKNFDDNLINWQQNDPTNTRIIDHKTWNNFLSQYIHSQDHINLLDYSRISKQSKIQLNAYIKHLSSIKIDQYNRREQQAFWINLYNALTVQLMLSVYPVESIKSVKLLKLSIKEFSPWDRNLVTIKGITLTLNDIEHNILRAYWLDPRIHYAVNCASISCPNLARLAYTASTIEEMLDKAAKDYINHTRAVNFVDSETLLLSSIYQWYSADFGGQQQTLLSHLIKYAEQPLATQLKNFSGKIKYHYNWNINDLATH